MLHMRRRNRRVEVRRSGGGGEHGSRAPALYTLVLNEKIVWSSQTTQSFSAKSVSNFNFFVSSSYTASKMIERQKQQVALVKNQ